MRSNGERSQRRRNARMEAERRCQEKQQAKEVWRGQKLKYG